MYILPYFDKKDNDFKGFRLIRTWLSKLFNEKIGTTQITQSRQAKPGALEYIDTLYQIEINLHNPGG